MNRRRFLSASVLGAAIAATPAKALEIVDCERAPGTGTCRKLTEHEEILLRLDAMLAEQGLAPDERKAMLAAASCPFCGLSLAGGGPGRF
jgi:hypothetical protein